MRLPGIALWLVAASCQVAPSAAPGATSGDALELVDAPATTDVAAYVAAQLGSAGSAGAVTLVYVGAAWCEPCRHFHEAAVAGRLAGDLAGVRLLQFDLDRDGPALEAAGYRSAMIPLFALPADDGQASGMQIAGSIKGDGAVAQIVPRLRTLIANRPR